MMRGDIHNHARKMAKTIQHRGPDSSNVWQDPESAVVLAHQRLSIIDLSEEGAQPMESQTGRYVLAYNGEIYNFMALRKDLEQQGISFRGRSDTEVILASIEFWGLNQALQKFTGMFAFALWDRQDKLLHLIRDRLGKKPLYFGWAGDCFVFGSELKALRAHPDFKPRLNTDALSLYARYSYLPSPVCIYQNVLSLPAGHRIALHVNDLNPGADLKHKIECYWSHKDALHQARDKSESLSDKDALEAFETLLSECVRERMISDVPLGAFLSGGIDSSAVVALMQMQSAQKIKTYTIGFEEDGFNEAGYAQKIAEHLDTDHHALTLNAHKAMEVLPLLSNMYDEPFADISAIPTYLVSKFARQDVTVALSGDGGDEMLGGYNRHIAAPKIWKTMSRIPKFMRTPLAHFIQKNSVERWNSLLRFLPEPGTRMHKIADILELGSKEAIFQNLISAWKEPHNLVLNSQEPEIPLTNPDILPEDLNFSEYMMFGDTMSYLPNDILTKVDRASMAVSLEARAPLLDKKIYDFVWSLPIRQKIRGGKGKWLLRELLARHVPRHLFERPKQGFTMPVGSWLKGDLREWAETLLDPKTLRSDGLFDEDMITQTWQAHLEGKGNHTERLWNILIFQSWKEKWL